MAEEMSVAIEQRAAVTQHPTRPFLWSIRRELWENLSILIAPLAVAAISELGFIIAAIRHGREFFAMAARSDGGSHDLIAAPFVFLAVGISLTMVLVAIFYSLDALYGERRDRSIFFWKSLPVSDLTTVTAKMAVPLIVLPAVTLMVVIAANILLLLLGSVAALLIGGPGLHLLWTQVPLPTIWLELAYTLIVTTLWYAPVYAWLMLVSSWARRAALLWAVLPFIVLALFEKIVFNTRHIVELLKYRFSGQFAAAFAADPHIPHNHQTTIPLSWLTPGRYLTSVGLWTGLIFAVVLFAVMVRMRRYREPL
ncbi:MAG TPA: ABC transporter permease [Acidobacteriaceae bacterium]|nr:ABC transporter permease [Acidobacteriaceae bacterium]